METIPENKATVKDYKKLPEGAPFELIEGNFISRFEYENSRYHKPYIKLLNELLRFSNESLNFQIRLAPFEVRLNSKEKLHPAICFFSNEQIDEKDYYQTTTIPLVSVEVLRPDNIQRVMMEKFFSFEKAGVREFFLVEPISQGVSGFELIDNSYCQFHFEAGFIRSKILNQEFHL